MILNFFLVVNDAISFLRYLIISSLEFKLINFFIILAVFFFFLKVIELTEFLLSSIGFSILWSKNSSKFFCPSKLLWFGITGKYLELTFKILLVK